MWDLHRRSVMQIENLFISSLYLQIRKIKPIGGIFWFEEYADGGSDLLICQNMHMQGPLNMLKYADRRNLKIGKYLQVEVPPDMQEFRQSTVCRKRGNFCIYSTIICRSEDLWICTVHSTHVGGISRYAAIVDGNCWICNSMQWDLQLLINMHKWWGDLWIRNSMRGDLRECITGCWGKVSAYATLYIKRCLQECNSMHIRWFPGMQKYTDGIDLRTCKSMQRGYLRICNNMQILAISGYATVWRRWGDPKVCKGSYPSEYTIEYTLQGEYI